MGQGSGICSQMWIDLFFPSPHFLIRPSHFLLLLPMKCKKFLSDFFFFPEIPAKILPGSSNPQAHISLSYGNNILKDHWSPFYRYFRLLTVLNNSCHSLWSSNTCSALSLFLSDICWESQRISSLTQFLPLGNGQAKEWGLWGWLMIDRERPLHSAHCRERSSLTVWGRMWASEERATCQCQ